MKDYIKKLKLATVEAELEVDLCRNTIVIGCDVSMHNTGLAVIKTTDDYLILDILHNIIVPKKIDLLKAADLFIDQIEDFKRKITQKYKLDINIIEDCFFGSNVKTLKSLARFSILIYDKLRGIATKSKLVLPTQARNLINFKKSSKEIKGSKLKKEIIEYINNALQINIKDDNLADGCVLALAGLVIKE